MEMEWSWKDLSRLIVYSKFRTMWSCRQKDQQNRQESPKLGPQLIQWEEEKNY